MENNFFPSDAVLNHRIYNLQNLSPADSSTEYTRILEDLRNTPHHVREPFVFTGSSKDMGVETRFPGLQLLSLKDKFAVIGRSFLKPEKIQKIVQRELPQINEVSVITGKGFNDFCHKINLANYRHDQTYLGMVIGQTSHKLIGLCDGAKSPHVLLSGNEYPDTVAVHAVNNPVQLVLITEKSLRYALRQFKKLYLDINK